MSGSVLLPINYYRRWTDYYKFFIERVCIYFNWEGYYVGVPDDNDRLIKNKDIILTYAIPIHSETEASKKRLDVICATNAKIICWTSDQQDYGNPVAKQNMEKMLDRADIILTPFWEYFCDNFPQYVYKAIFFPVFIAPKTRYSDMPFNDNPIRKCLMSGAINNEVYFIRQKVFNYMLDHESQTHIVHAYPPYQAQHDFIGDKYASFLNAYFCSVTCSSKFNYVVAKYMEIPAAGTLLLANETKDSIKLGFVPNEHFIPITENNVMEQIDFVLSSWKHNEYDSIRKNAKEFVLENHTIDNRFEQFKQIMKDL